MGDGGCGGRSDRHHVVRAQRGSVRAVGSSRGIVGRLAIVYHIFVVRMGIAVILPALVLRLHIQLCRVLLHLKCSNRSADRVVGLGGRAVPCQSVGVLARANLRLAARHREGGRLLSAVGRGHKARDRTVGCQGCTVVLFVGALRNNRQGRRCHAQLALRLRLAGIESTMGDFVGKRIRHLALSYVGDRSRSRRRNRNLVTGRQRKDHAIAVIVGRYFRTTVRHRVNRLRVGIAVVGPGFRGRRDLDRTVVHRDRQVGRDIDNMVVVSHIVVAIANGCCTRDDFTGVCASLGLATRQGDARQLVAILKTRNRHIGVETACVSAGRTLCLTVVHIGLRFGRDGYGIRFYDHRHILLLHTTSMLIYTGGLHRPSIGTNCRLVGGDLAVIIGKIGIVTTRCHDQVRELVRDDNRSDILTVGNRLSLVGHGQLCQRIDSHFNSETMTNTDIANLRSCSISNLHRVLAVCIGGKGKHTVNGRFILIASSLTGDAVVILRSIPRIQVGGTGRSGTTIRLTRRNIEMNFGTYGICTRQMMVL